MDFKIILLLLIILLILLYLVKELFTIKNLLKHTDFSQDNKFIKSKLSYLFVKSFRKKAAFLAVAVGGTLTAILVFLLIPSHFNFSINF